MTDIPFGKLYKKDTNGSIRVWWIEVNGDAYRAISGVYGGKMVEADWTIAVPKNVGRSNETSGAEQALAEAKSIHEKKSKAGRYFSNINDVDQKTYTKPMLAEKYKDVTKHIEKAFAQGKRVFSQPKLDGYRAVVMEDGVFTRNGERYFTVPHVLEFTKEFTDANIGGFLDGELYNHEFKSDFNRIQSLVSPNKKEPTAQELADTLEHVQYHIYDMFSVEDPNADFSMRKAYLDHMEAEGFFNNSILIRVPTVEVKSFEEIDEQYAILLEAGYEGQILRIDGPYENKRTKNLIKRKEFFDEEFTITSIEEGLGNWNGKAKVVHLIDPKTGITFKATPKGTEDEMRALLARASQVVGSEATVRFPNKTPDGIPRFGIVVAIHDGKRTA